jgi:hypothetical protein
LKKLNLLISCCKECPFVEEGLFMFVCSKTRKNIHPDVVSSVILEDCFLEDVVDTDGDKSIKVSRFELLDFED